MFTLWGQGRGSPCGLCVLWSGEAAIPWSVGQCGADDQARLLDSWSNLHGCQKWVWRGEMRAASRLGCRRRDRR